MDRQGRRFRIEGGAAAGECVRIRFPEGFSVRKVMAQIELESARPSAN
jgi:hypothetical protein